MTDLPKEMRALRVLEKGSSQYTLETIPVPKPTESQALLKIGAAGFCHTDMLVLKEDFGGVYPVTGSHEPVGTVVALGPDVKGGVKVGDRVAGFLHLGVCHKCPDCTLVNWVYCPRSYYTGLNTDGAFAEYQIVDANLLVPIPDTMSFEQAAPLTCAGVTIYSAIKKANLKPGQIIAISGLGALGHLGVQFAKAMGLKVVGIDARPEPVSMTRGLSLAPHLTFDATQTTAEDAVKEIVKLRPEGYVGWDGVDAVILTADPVSSHQYGIDISRRHGLVIMVAQPPKIQLDYHDLIFKNITLIGSLHGNTDDLRDVVEFCVKFGIKSDVTTFGMEEHVKMVQGVHDEKRKGKSVMVM